MKVVFENKGAKIISGNKEELEMQIANEFVSIISEKENPKVIFATGNSPVSLYKKMIDKNKEGKLSFLNLESFNLDEYLDMTDEQFKKYSFREFMNDNLFNQMDIDKEKTHFPTENVEEYNKLLDSKVDKFDWTILGVGSNGHIAFNEPGTPFTYRTNIVELKESTIKDNFGESEDYLSRAVTMGMSDIYNKSSKIVLLAWGEAKRKALEMFMKKSKDSQWPITNFIDHDDITIYTDLTDLK